MLILAAERECPAGHAAALSDLLSLAMTKGPARGIFDPAASGEDALYTAFEAVARRHLGMEEARASWQRGLRRARLESEIRDTIESRALRVQGVSDTVYYYAGLAFGLTCGSFYRVS
jgi:hypothetical protein